MLYAQIDIEDFNRVAFQFIETEITNHIFTITLNRPAKRNAFTSVMVNELAYALSYAELKKDIWCVVIQAKGPVFCAGMDLLVFQNAELDVKNSSLPNPQRVITLGDAFRVLTKPSVAKIAGPVFAGGFLIVCGCTFAVAADTVEFSLPEVKRGIFPMQVISSLLTMMPQRQALQLCILAETFAAHKALELGIISHVCPPDRLEEECGWLLNTILGHSPYAIAKGFQAVRVLPNLPEYARHGFLQEQLKNIRASQDAMEGISAFSEKRDPVWKNA